MEDQLTGLRLSDHQDRTWSFAEISEEIGSNPDTLRAWFNIGGLALAPPFDHVSKGGRGSSHRLHWRTVVLLLLAIKFSDYGLSLRSGEAAGAAGAVFAAGLDLAHLSSEMSPLISVSRDGDGAARVGLVERGAPAGMIEAPLIGEAFEGVGTLLVDPIGIGRVLWRLAINQGLGEEEADSNA